MRKSIKNSEKELNLMKALMLSLLNEVFLLKDNISSISPGLVAAQQTLSLSQIAIRSAAMQLKANEERKMRFTA